MQAPFRICLVRSDRVSQVQINYFLDNWNDIRNSDSMRNIWQQIRMGRHPGFEEGQIIFPFELSFI